MEPDGDENERNNTPRNIHRLPEDVINRIAAGEVVVRPSAALKELLENSLDAGAKSITVSAREGGIKLLQVSDNGKGIEYDDLPLLCERFATSKITKFEDLETVDTFGFRGEALSSISHVARVSVLTKTAQSPLAYKVAYLDGQIKNQPEAAAGTNGTAITVEDMFYNLLTRKRTLRSATEEYRAIVDVVARYSIKYPDVSFICRKHPGGGMQRLSSGTDVRTDGSSSVKENICNAFGSLVANEIKPFDVRIPKADAQVSGYFSSANFNSRKGVFILFINGRLIDCKPFKRAIWNLYSNYLPKNSFPFIYMDVNMKQSDIDVNVHPAKKEVRFLHEEIIIQTVIQDLNSGLKGTEASRSFPTQSILVPNKSSYDESVNSQQPISTSRSNIELSPLQKILSEPKTSEPTQTTNINDEHVQIRDSRDSVAVANDSTTENLRPGKDLSIALESRESDRPIKQKISSSKGREIRPSNFKIPHTNIPRYPKDKVRIGDDAPVGLFDKYIRPEKGASPAPNIQPRRRRRESAVPLLTSVQNLLQDIRTHSHKGMEAILTEHQVVGTVSERLILLQHGTRLLLVEIEPLVVQLMYQQCLTHFGDHDVFKLSPPAPITKLISSYINNLPTDPTISRIGTETCISILLEKGPMLKEYFGISIIQNSASDVELDELPMFLPDIIPNIEYLSSFLYHLVLETDWDEEETCFRGICSTLANWYGKHWTVLKDHQTMENSQNQNTISQEKANDKLKTPQNAKESVTRSDQEQRQWSLQHVIFAAMRSGFYVPRKLSSENIIREITSTSKLYKIFERC